MVRTVFFGAIIVVGLALCEPLKAATPLSTLEEALLARALTILNDDIPNGSIIATRDLTNSALAILAAGGNPSAAQKLLTLAFSVQNIDPTSATYGSFPWYYNSSAVTDENADDYTAQALGPIWIHYRQLFPASFQSEMQTHMQGVISALLRRNVAVTYTNIYLMDAVSLLLIGQSVGNTTAINAGTEAIQEWVAYTQGTGIYEYGAPTYYSIDLDSLVMGFLYATEPSMHVTFQNILNEFWTDVKANYFYGQQDVSGAHSRDYDFLYGRGAILYYLWTEGLNSWYTTDVNLVEMGQVYVIENGLASAGYHPNWNALPGVSNNSSKWIVQTSGTLPNGDRENWVTSDFALGSASASYGPQDKLINLKLATTKQKFPDISIVPDIYNAPYGLVVSPDSEGHLKPDHLALNPASVQKLGMLLTLLDLNPSQGGSISNLATNILLPVQANSISINGKSVDLSRPIQYAVKTGSWIGVRENTSAVLIRMFSVDALNGVSPQMVLQSDAGGVSYGAARLTAYHYQGSAANPVRFTATHLKIGILIIAYHCANESAWKSLLADALASQISAAETNGAWQVQAEVGGPEGGNLEIIRSLADRSVFTRIGGGE